MTKNLTEKGFSDQNTVLNVESEILEVRTLIFEENQLIDSTSESNCDPYGCTCISHEKCCGCIIQ